MEKIKIAWYGIHEGEEPPLTPAGGIFFSGCNLSCVFCQNYQISQQGLGKFYLVEDLVKMMIELQGQGAKNIDLVTPTIWYKQIKAALLIAKEKGLKIPIVWNSNAFEDLEILCAMEGLVDIYLPDFKYSNDDLAYKYSGVKNYFHTASKAIAEMWRQVGNLEIENGTAKKGVIVRHLVLPNNLQNSFGVLNALLEINKNIHLSLMNQYLPMHKAGNFEELTRVVSEEEFAKAYDYLLDLGFCNGWVQGEKSQENLVPDFTKIEPFN